MPNAKNLLLWSGSVFLVLTLSCAAPSQTTKPESSAPAPTPEQAEVTPTAVQPDVTPTPVPAPVAAVERTLPPADSGPRNAAKRSAPPAPPEELASAAWSKAEEPPAQAWPQVTESEQPQEDTVSESGLASVQPAGPLNEEPAPRPSRAGSLWLVFLGVAVVVLAVVIWMAGRRRTSARPARVEDRRHPAVEAKPAERPHAAHEAKPAPLAHAKEETGKQLVLPAIPEAVHHPTVRVAASAKKTAGKRKTVARKTTRGRKEGTRRAAAARRRSTAAGRRKVVAVPKRPTRRRKA